MRKSNLGSANPEVITTVLITLPRDKAQEEFIQTSYSLSYSLNSFMLYIKFYLNRILWPIIYN